MKAAIGQSVDILCSADGFPDPDVRISKLSGQSHLKPDSVSLTTKSPDAGQETTMQSHGSRSAVLRLEPLTAADAGRYVCTAWNGGAQLRKELAVSVSG